MGIAFLSSQAVTIGRRTSVNVGECRRTSLKLSNLEPSKLSASLKGFEAGISSDNPIVDANAGNDVNHQRHNRLRFCNVSALDFGIVRSSKRSGQ